MGRSPLDHPRLAVIDKKLDAGELDEAQHLLSQLGDNYFFRHATTYLASRLLFLRGTLDQEGLVDRLQRVLNETQDFPEAEALLAAAKSGTLAGRGEPRSSRPPAAARSSHPPRPEIEIAFGARSVSDGDLMSPDIPKAGRLPSLASSPRSGRGDSIPDLEITGKPPPGFGHESAGHAPAKRDSEDRLSLSERSPRPAETEGARYSTAPGSIEEIAVTRKRTGPGAPQRPREIPSLPRASTEPLIGTDPPPEVSERVSLFDVAALLDAGRPDEALAALATRGSPEEPDHALLQARALARAGRRDQALELARRLGAAPLLEPTIRAGVARLALEQNEGELALEQAELAHEDDPLMPTIRLTYAWAALRHARRTADAELVSRASLALRDVVGDGGPHEGLLVALRACIEAHAGDAERALVLAERSLLMGPTAEGYAALAMAAARLARAEETKRAIQGLFEQSPDEARALADSLERHGERLFELQVQQPSILAPAMSADVEAASLWGPLELAVVEGQFPRAFETFAQLAEDTLAQVTRTTRHEPPALAAVAASFFTIAPLSRDLAPYDQTPWSIPRVADLARLLSKGASELAHDHPLVILLGTYVGESLRLSIAGARWQGPADDPRLREITSERGTHRPYELVRSALSGGRELDSASSAAIAGVSGHAPSSHMPAVTPVCPWDPAPWPAPSRLPHYAAALERSVVSVLCSLRSGEGLDGSLGSLHALDAHLARVAPEGSSPDRDARWARRATVLAGAYLGEVLRRETGGSWTKGDELELGPSSYRLRLPNGRELWPVEHAFARLTSGGVTLERYAERVLAA